MKRASLILLPSLVLLVIAAAAVTYFADRSAQREIAPGTRIAGVAVGGLSRQDALAVLQKQVAAPLNRDTTVRVSGHAFRLTAARAGVALDLAQAVDRAYAAGRTGSIVQRAWRKVRGERSTLNEPAPVSVDKTAVRRFVSRIHQTLARKPTDATLDISLHAVTVAGGTTGRRLGGRVALEHRIEKALVEPGGRRAFKATMVKTEPKVTAASLWEETPVAVTVSRAEKTVRVFRKGEMVTSYRVAVGEPRYPTPTGQFVVQTMQVNPVWTVPDSEWAGDMAGKVVPGGDPQNPLVARWIGFNGSVGFHGTASLGSLGTAASHGCVRMNPRDVIDLYDRVTTGTPVLVA